MTSLRRCVMAAYRECVLIKNYYSHLQRTMLHPLIVANQLYEKNIIDPNTKAKLIGTDPSKDADFLLSAIEAYFYSVFDDKDREKEFLDVLDVLHSHIPLNKVVAKMKEEYYDDDRNETDHSKEEDSRLKSLTIALRVYSGDLDKSGIDSDATLNLVKSRIKEHIEKSLEEGVKPEILRQHLIELNRDALIPEDITDWCYKKLEETQQMVEVTKNSPPTLPKVDSPTADLPPLFSKSTVYHASLCAFVASTYSSGRHEDILNVEGHSFSEMSLSKSAKQKMFIAVTGDIFYIAFEGESCIEKWLEYSSVLEGLDNQTECIPLRYFFELLRQGKRLVFTGFSFGGLLASYITAKLWNLPLVSTQSLLTNVTCIMFGVPLTPIKLVQETVKESPKILQSFHSFYLKDDHIPKLLRFLEVSIFTKLVGGAKLSERSWPNLLLHCLLKVQSADEKEKNNSLSRLKDILKDALKINMMQAEIGVHTGSTYMISQSNHQGLISSKLYDPEQELIYMGVKNIENLTLELFAQHSMAVYRYKVLRGYLDKDPPFEIPAVQLPNLVTEIKSLKPSISDVELFVHVHPHGKELAIVIKGDHLWFSNKIKIDFENVSESIEIEITANNIAQKQIECIHTLDEQSDLFKHGVRPLKELATCITINSQFSASIRKRVIALLKYIDPISFRQSQLAKQTPSQIIKLAFLSALLEQPPLDDVGSRPSKRYQFILKFLQEAARIVPMESIFFAIANCSSEVTALKCANALIQNILPSQIPVSSLIVEGCAQAALRLSTIAMRENWFMQAPLLQPSRHVTQLDQRSYSEATASTQTTMQYQKQPSSKLEELFPSKIAFDARMFNEIHKQLCEKSDAQIAKREHINLVSGRNIGEVYPISKALEQAKNKHINAFAPLPDILRIARNTLRSLAVEQRSDIGCFSTHNSQMLRCVNSMIENNLDPCVTMLGGFMEQQIRVPLVDNPFDTALALTASHGTEAVGVWALFALKNEDILKILSTSKNQSLVVQIAKYIQGIFNQKKDQPQDLMQDMNYAGKLQFLIQGMEETVTCSSHYISYSLERELVGLCKKLKINTSSKVESVIRHWDDKFKDTALSLVPETHRPLLARWLIWALNIHRLREGLASYTTIGIIGLVNSGKSTLVQKLFKKRAVAGTTQAARTTVPLIYNMEEAIKGLSIIDFPGVDDRDDSIPELAAILVGLAQIVIFLCSFERFHTKSAGDWMQHFEKEFASIPVLVCLTHADKLYEDNFKSSIPVCQSDKQPEIQYLVKQELKKIVGGKYSDNTMCNIQLCSLLQNEYSPMNSDEGRSSLQKVGIYTPYNIGQWIQEMLKSHLQQPELAEEFAGLLKQ